MRRRGVGDQEGRADLLRKIVDWNADPASSTDREFFFLALGGESCWRPSTCADQCRRALTGVDAT